MIFLFQHNKVLNWLVNLSLPMNVNFLKKIASNEFFVLHLNDWLQIKQNLINGQYLNF